MEKHYKVTSIHKRQDLLDETIRLINYHWPKSRSERLSILGSSKDNLPMSLILTFRKKQTHPLENTKIMNDIFLDRQSIDAPVISSETGKPINVLGHLRLVPVPADDKACFIESMVIHHDFRGKGIGSFFIKEMEKFCEEVLHLKAIFLSTYDSGEFYMKIGFQLTSAICVYGNGEKNTVTKKIFLKKELNYIEPEEPEPVVENIYDPNKDYNYRQQQQIQSDIILSGFPFKMENCNGLVDRLCQLITFPSKMIKYFYSFEYLNRKTDRRSFHMIISNVSVEAKNEMLEKLKAFGVLCFQNFFEKPVNEWDNTLITHAERLTNLNYALYKELLALKQEKWITDFKFENYQFHAFQKDEWRVVKNMGVIEVLKIPELPDIPDEEIVGWDVPEEEDLVMDNLEKLRQHFKLKENESWLPMSLRRPSQIMLEPLEKKCNEIVKLREHVKAIRKEAEFPLDIDPMQESSTTWTKKFNCCSDAITMGLLINNS